LYALQFNGVSTWIPVGSVKLRVLLNEDLVDEIPEIIGYA